MICKALAIIISIVSVVREVCTLFCRGMCGLGSLGMLPGRGGMTWGLTEIGGRARGNTGREIECRQSAAHKMGMKVRVRSRESQREQNGWVAGGDQKKGPPGARLCREGPAVKQRTWRTMEDMPRFLVQGSFHHSPWGGSVITGNQFRPEGICTSLP